MYEWTSFLYTADQWFINYACTPSDLISVVTFSIGHTIELYLKATYTKKTGDSAKAIDYSHNIKRLWDDCKNLDTKFMPNYEIRNSILAKDLFQGNFWEKLSKDDMKHFLDNEELYLIAKLLKDLKYLGTPLKFNKGPHSIGCIHPNDYWIRFFKELRNYLEYPSKDRLDFIKHKLDEGDLPYRSVKYLQQLYA